ncbi:PAS domain-containing protein [Rhodococcus sp. P1Y]|uniref:PAS domain-containing protein n=1 Tax=Rhodococcus sp. P1Y TaxID=1302308 RepID=UPI001F1D15EF|nr:PAS domain-containing protein [Rhodococcus sp. P1Y]
MTDSNSTGERRKSETSAISDPAQFPDLPVTVVLDRIPVPILAVDPSGAIVFANEAFDELFGTDRSEPSDFHLRHFPGPGSRGRQRRGHVSHDGRDSRRLLWRMTDKTGDVVQVRASKSILRRAEDNLVLVALEDFTDQLWNDPKGAAPP